jgi:hypothetical protein
MKNYPEAVAHAHSEDNGYGMPAVTGRPDDGMLGIRWDNIIDAVRERPQTIGREESFTM